MKKLFRTGWLKSSCLLSFCPKKIVKTASQFCLLLVLVLFSCSKKAASNFDSNFDLYRDYISSFSTGFTSVESDIRVQLAFNSTNWKTNQVLDEDLFEISPKVKGKVIALSNSTLAFVPEEKLEQNTLYQVRLKLAKINPQVPKELEHFNFSFKTIKQDFVVSTLDLQSYDQKTYYLNGVLKTADNLSFESAQQLLKVSQLGEDVKIVFDKANSNSKEFKFSIEKIKRLENESQITIAWDGDVADIEQEGEMIYTIPAQNDFKVLDIKIGDENNQTLLINFSDPLKKDQDFKGLVAIENTENLKYSTMGNVLKVFFDNQNSPEEKPIELTTTQTNTETDSTSTVVEVDTVSYYSDEVESSSEAAVESFTSVNAFSGTKLIEVFQGIENDWGAKMKQNYNQQVAFDPIKPGIKLLKNGTILPSSNNLNIHFQVANLNAVDVKVYKIYTNNILQFLQDNALNGTQNLKQVSQAVAKTTIELQQNQLTDYSKWNTYSLDISKIIEPEPGAIYRVEFSFRKKYSMYKCGNSTQNSEEETAEEEEIDENDVNYSGSYESYYYEEDYDYIQSLDPCSDNYYFQNTKIGTNILATDLGVIVKKGTDKSVVVAVSDIVSTDAISGAKVSLYNFQQQKIAESSTDSDGMASFQLEKIAYFAIISKDNQSTYVKLDDENSLSVSNFDVGGETLQKGLKGYLYGERGVWRPGDTVYLSFILNDKANPLPASHPIKLTLNDPNGKTTYQTVRSWSDLHHYKFEIPTAATAPTGNWEAIVSVGGARFYKSIKIETIKPNRLKIKNSLKEGLLSASKTNRNTIQALWLHGAVAKDLKIEVQAKFSAKTTQFKAWANYVFDDLTRNFATEEISIFSGKVDANGKATIPIEPQLQGQAPGMLQAAFITKIYEQGGDVSTDVASTVYSPYPTYVGIKAPQPNRYGMLETGTNNRFEIVSLSENGLPKASQELEIRVYKLESRWWWDASNDNLSNYSASTATMAYKSFRLKTNSNGKGNLSFSVPENDWGNYLIRATDPKGGHATAVKVYIDSPYWTARSKNGDGKEANMLRFSTDKSHYAVGETAKLFFPSSQGGRALISLENGTKVIQSFWVKTKAGETAVDLPITATMTPNAYISITLLQPHASTENDSPIRMYGIVPIEVIDKNTVLEPQISMPQVLRPEQTVGVKVSEKQGKRMTFTLAVVDEGLLDLTRFSTPNAWSSFYTREALGVRTWDIYDDVIGAYGGKTNQIFAIGGDANLGGAQAKKANRFKPVVLYFGPFELGKSETKTIQLKLPKYIGSVRTMVVAANAEETAYGMAEKTTPVKSPLMVLASLPRKISPSEKVTIPVTLFATENSIKKVNVQIKTNSKLRLIGKTRQTISFSTPDEKMAYFDLAVGNSTGIGKVEIIAQSGKEKAVYEVAIDVTNPNPITTTTTDAVIAAQSSQKINWKLFGVSGSNVSKIEISSVPTIDFSRRLDYLIQYPHGCVEQTTSAVFPQLYLNQIMDLNADYQQKIQQNVTAGIQKLSNFQLTNGGFTYWPGLGDADDWGSSYAGHFLIEAEKKGYVLPINFKNKWISYQQKMAKRWRFEKQYGNDLAQAYRLYTLCLAGAPDLASMNRLRETSGIANESKLRLAAAYALIQQTQAGLSLLNQATIEDSEPTSYYYYYGSADRNRAMALETLLLLGQKQKAFAMATQLAKQLSSNEWMSTQTTAYGLYAMAKFAQSNGGKGIDVQYTNGGKTQIIRTAKSLAQRNLVLVSGNNSLSIKNNKKSTLFVRILNSGILPVGKENEIQNNLSAKMIFKNRKGQPISVSKITQGTEFIAVVSLTNQKNEYVENIALSQILPSGFEIVNTRYTDYGSSTSNTADYIDIRDDRAQYYFGLKANETRTFQLLLNASYLGRYYFPGLQCEAMYDNSFLARTKGQWVEVVR